MSTVSARLDLATALERQPRVPLATLPTPLDDAARLREALGGRTRCPRILIKRDDLTGLALGGNKARKLEFLIGDALAERATTVITTGAVQSNHARMTAAAARRCGLGVALVLTDHDDAAPPPRGQSAARPSVRRARSPRAGGGSRCWRSGHDEALVAHVADAHRVRGRRGRT